jgi:hypothetical protein
LKIIGLFSIHRTGTNYLHSVLRQWASLASFDELFHPTRVYGLKPAHRRALSNRAGVEFIASPDNDVGQDFTQWARAHPLEVIDTLERVVARKDRGGLMFKVFNNQWVQPPGEVIAALARRPHFVPIVLKRRCIDVYVSFRKAEACGKYKHVDTTSAPVTLDPAAYERWAKAARTWFQLVDGALARAGSSPLRLRYEQDIDMPPAALSVHWADLLGLAPGHDIDATLAVQRQDRATNLEAKIANHDDFKAALVERGLWQEALGWFEDAPDP